MNRFKKNRSDQYLLLENKITYRNQTGSNWAQAQISKHLIQVEPTMFEPLFIFEPRLKFLKFGLW